MASDLSKDTQLKPLHEHHPFSVGARQGGTPPHPHPMDPRLMATGEWGNLSLISQTRHQAQKSPENWTRDWFERKERVNFSCFFF